MLRYWAMNMAAVNYNWIGFDYSSSERHRLGALTREMPEGSYVSWVAATVVLYGLLLMLVVPVFMGPLLILYPTGTVTPASLFYMACGSMIVFLLSFGMPLAMSLGGGVVNRMCGAPAFKEIASDYELYRKIRFQITCVAVMGILATGLLSWIASGFEINLSHYDTTVRALYYVAVGLQFGLASLAFRR